jgi:uncharacterized protein
MKKNRQDIKFKSQKLLLKGVLHLPEIENPPLVVGSHGLEGSKESAKQKVLSRILVQNNIAFFRFDHRGCGQSQGDFIKDTSLEKRTRDFINAVQHILSLKKTSQNIAVFGSSMGGATCINAWESLLKMDINLCGAVICSAPVKSLTIENIPIEANGDRPALPLSFFKNNLVFDLQDKTQRLYNVMIFHGDTDEVVPVSNALDIYSLAKEPKQLIIHKKGDHQMSSKKDQREFETKSVSWFLSCFKNRDQMTS